MGMIEGRLGPDALELLGADVDRLDARRIVEVRNS